MKKGVRKSLIYSLLAFFVFSLSFSKSSAQWVWEAGLNIGPGNFLGDLGGNQGKGKTFLKDNNIELTRMFFGVFVGASPNEFVNFRLGFNYGNLAGADSVIDGKGGWEEARRTRNLHFKTNIKEIQLVAELYPTVFLEEDPTDIYHKWRPYGVIGVGAFKFNPQGEYIAPNGTRTWVALKPLRTEGQGMPNHPNVEEYSLTQLNIPYGIGLKYFISEKVNVSLEIVNRKTFTDYMDDVSGTFIDPADFYNYFGASSLTAQIADQMANKTTFANGGTARPSFSTGDKRGTITNNDAYYATTLKLGIRFGGGENYNSNQTRCPILRF
jgi:Domain of unknown function (DUF6089)